MVYMDDISVYITQDPFIAKISEYLQLQKVKSTSKSQDLQHTVSKVLIDHCAQRAYTCKYQTSMQGTNMPIGH